MKQWLIDLLKQYFFLLFPFIVVFNATLYNSADSDLGWHLKYGEYFFKHGSVLRDNIFSTSMISYHWINHSWATDLITYLAFKNFGFLGLTILGGLIIALTFYFFSQAAKLSFWGKALVFPVLIYFETPLNIVSFRTQLLSLLGIGILYYLISRFEQGERKFLFFTIPLFFVWANIHGGFVLGMLIFFAWIWLYLIQQFFLIKKTNSSEKVKTVKFLAILFLCGLLVTLINPFGVGIYSETLHHFDKTWQQYIIEWLPFDKFSQLWWQLIIWGGFLAAAITAIFKKKLFRAKFPYIAIALIFFLLSFWMRRYAWPMYYLSIPVLQPLTELVGFKNSKLNILVSSTILILFYSLITFAKNPREQFLAMNWNRYCRQYVSCSAKAAEYIINHRLTDRLLTFYNWGGWLIWNYPQIKPSIDGRMPAWIDDRGYSAFVDYYAYEQNWQDIDNSGFDVVFMTPKKMLYNRLLELVKEDKWQLVYKDAYSGVFVRKNAPKLQK
ncbi:hypothetical protein HY008_03000 [Candidatus Woesebacteria bacterium]|nr:hypothetical protein [Candidatus Woesebacteria bacterium]